MYSWNCGPVHEAELPCVLLHEARELGGIPAVDHRAEVLLSADEHAEREHQATRDAPREAVREVRVEARLRLGADALHERKYIAAVDAHCSCWRLSDYFL